MSNDRIKTRTQLEKHARVMTRASSSYGCRTVYRITAGILTISMYQCWYNLQLNANVTRHAVRGGVCHLPNYPPFGVRPYLNNAKQTACTHGDNYQITRPALIQRRASLYTPQFRLGPYIDRLHAASINIWRSRGKVTIKMCTLILI